MCTLSKQAVSTLEIKESSQSYSQGSWDSPISGKIQYAFIFIFTYWTQIDWDSLNCDRSI